jgi:hypothetical protein
VYWINKPLDLNKCHSRRCDDPAMWDRLCSKHWAAWQLAGFQPPVPPQYSGQAATESTSPLKDELHQDVVVLKDVIHEIANLPVDKVATQDKLQSVLRELEKEKAEIAKKKADSVAPLAAALKRTTNWFEPVEKNLEQAIEVAKTRLETSRSTIQNLKPGRRPAAKKAGGRK